MKKIIKLIMTLIPAVLVMSLGSCGKKQELSMTYEQPINTLTGAIINYDEEAYLSCFTNAAKEEYKSAQDYSDTFIESIYPRTSEQHKLSTAIIEHLELEDADIKKLEESYVRRFRKRIDISKAISMSVRFKVFKNEQKRTILRKMIVVRVDNTWYIYGEVPKDLDLSVNNAMFSDILEIAENDDDSDEQAEDSSKS